MRSSAQNKLTAVGRVFASVETISLNSSSKFFALLFKAPRATPIAAATPIAGAPRITIWVIAAATSL
jgi:hypothetical protein